MKYLKYYENLNEITQEDIDILFIDLIDKSFKINLHGKIIISICRMRNFRSDAFKFSEIEETLKTAVHYLKSLYYLTDIRYDVYGQVSEPQPEFTLDYKGFQSDKEKGLDPFEPIWLNSDDAVTDFRHDNLKYNREDVWIDEMDIILK